MKVHLDLTQLLMDPKRTGIQRAERELIRHWPGPSPLIPCRFVPETGALHELPGDVLRILSDEPPEGDVPAELARLAPFMAPGPVLRPDRLLCAELFSDRRRAAYYRRLAGHPGVHWLVYDFLPWLRPGWFYPGAPVQLMPFIHALQAVKNVAFISQATKRDYVERVGRRASDAPVMPMGGDGLKLERQSFAPQRRRFVMLGTIEPRKNAAPVMQAFQKLWAEGIDAELTMIGIVALDAPVELALLAELSGDNRFLATGQVSDEAVREHLRSARAMLFPSTGEGYGIPPMEALHAGIPVVVSSELPALEGQPSFGQIRLETVTPDTVAEAVRTLLDDDRAARLWQSAASMPVQGWADFARQIATWVQSATRAGKD